MPENSRLESSRIVSKSTVAIVGAGRMGRLLATLLKRRHRLILYDRDHRKAQQAAAKIKVQAGTFTDLHKADVVIVCVPIEATVGACADALEVMRRDSLLAEISSVKTNIVGSVERLLHDNIEYLSLHPLFGSSTRTTKGLNIVAIPVRRGPITDRLIRSFRKTGLDVQISTVKEHDRIMAAMQVAHHYAYLVLATQLAQAFAKSPRVAHFATKSIKKTLDQLCSIQKNIETIFEIQKLNPYSLQARKTFSTKALRMAEMKDDAIAEIRQSMMTLQNLARQIRK